MQKSLTQFVIGAWIMVAFFGMLYIGPAVHFVYKIPLIASYAITALIVAIITGILHMLPLMLGLGVLLYRKQWKKAEARSIVLQASIYESYLITLIRPIMLQTLFLIPGLLLIGYLLEKGSFSHVIFEAWPVFYSYMLTFLLGAITRIGLEFFEQWQIKRNTKNQKPHSDV